MISLYRLSTMIFISLSISYPISACQNSNQPENTPILGAYRHHVEYSWQNGSVPPKYHYEYRISIYELGQSKITLLLGYQSVPVWQADITIPSQNKNAIFKLFKRLTSKRCGQPENQGISVGSIGSASYNISGGGNDSESLTVDPLNLNDACLKQRKKLADLIVSSVPKESIDFLNARIEAFKKDSK